MPEKKTINVITLGCSKNLVDSEKIMGQLKDGPFDITHEKDGPSDIVIINTCGFIHDAKEESVDVILQYAKAKKQGLIEEVVVTGCLSERYKEELAREIPEADAWFGVKDTAELFSYLNQKYASDNETRFLTTPGHFAYLKIAEGCDRTCSFCAIPLIRGRYRSRTTESLVKETQQLVSKGVKEVLLIAQDLSYYGYDLQKKSMLYDLLKELVKIEGLQWIRLHYAYPSKFPKEVIDLMAVEPKICKYLDIPLQHISDPLLKSMRRNTSKSATIALLNDFRRAIPDVALRTTLLVGYPGETQEHFEELVHFVKETRFERLGVFAYSAEEGTHAYKLKDTVSEEEKQRRVEHIMAVQQNISLDINRRKIGKSLKVVIDREEEHFFMGRTEYDSPEVDNEVNVEKQEDIEPGQFYQVRITDAADHELYGKIENP